MFSAKRSVVCHPNKTWATLITGPSYVPGLLTLYRTLVAVSKYELVVMATKDLPSSSREVILKAGMKIVDVQRLSPNEPPGFDPKFARFDDTWTKLQVFGLTQYERVILIDSDMVFLRAMDELFDIELPGLDWIAAAPACVCNPLKIAHYPADWVPANCCLLRQTNHTTLDSLSPPDPDGPRTSHLLNSGLVVLQPSTPTMQGLVHHLNTSPTVAHMKFPDQDLIAEVFHGRWQPLPWWCNALKPGRGAHPEVWLDSEVRLIHYILDKPWFRRPAFMPSFDKRLIEQDDRESLPRELIAMVKDSPPQQSLTNYDTVHAWWWVVYEVMLEEMRMEGLSKESEEIESHVYR